ncbi:MAG: hypothetical protein J7J16_01975 [Deltaproteobacteria bacterium]|nr:hypothetical protein [Deltaproteobacteria bacterium]
MMKKIEKARAQLLLKSPFFGRLALHFNIVFTSSVQTIKTDYEKLYINPRFISSLSVEELQFMIGHEILHCILDHFSRRETRIKEKWDAACDFAVNSILLEAGVGEKPKQALYNKCYHGLYAEEIYALLPEFRYRIIDEHHDFSMDESRRTKAQQKWRSRVTQTINTLRDQGDSSSSEQRLIDLFAKPRLSWRRMLKSLIMENVLMDWSWHPPSRRHIHDGLILPGLKRDTTGIPVGIDTSGSISKKELTLFLSEIVGIIQHFPSCSLTLIFCDAQVHAVCTIATLGQLQEAMEKIRGGGGTNFEPVFQWVEKNLPFPPCLIYLTDLCGTFPSHPPSYPVIWVSVGNRKTAPFGCVVTLNDKD